MIHTACHEITNRKLNFTFSKPRITIFLISVFCVSKTFSLMQINFAGSILEILHYLVNIILLKCVPVKCSM